MESHKEFRNKMKLCLEQKEDGGTVSRFLVLKVSHRATVLHKGIVMIVLVAHPFAFV
jgi:hypothetical protein